MSKLPSKSKALRRRRGRRLRLELLEGRLLLTGIFVDEAAEISGAVWYDFNANGSRQIEDSGVSGRIVFLDDNANGQLDFTEHHTRTDVNGEFEFRGLSDGVYLVSVITPDGWEATHPSGDTHTVELTSDGSGERVEFGTQRVWGSVLGLVWNDTDGDGQQDADESGAKGWPVFLDANSNGELDQGEKLTISGDYGHFQFPDLEPGDYSIALLPREGWSHSQPATGSQSVQLARGELKTGVTLASQPVWGIVEGTVRGEPNGEGSGLTGLDGWTVFLDANENGELDDGEQKTATDASGRFRFTEVDGGRYALTMQIADPWSVVTPESGDNAIEIEVVNGFVTANQQFVVERISGGIEGLVWHDDNANGDQEQIELGLANWVVFLDTNENGVLDEGESHTESDESGRYTFDSLATGAYRVVQVLRDGWHETVANLGNKLVELAKGQIVGEIDFSNDRQMGGLRGVVWQDQNHDAKRDDEESPLVGWVVYLDTN